MRCFLTIATLLLCSLHRTSAFVTSSSLSTRIPSTTRSYMQTVKKSKEEWKETLTDDQYYVLFEEGTEPPNTSSLNLVKDPGTFSCAACGSPLFTTETKFDSGTGWPSFYSPVDKDAVALSTDFKLILPRTECSCSSCGGHLGHVFSDGPEPTGQRFCMNGVAMKFTSDEADPELATSVAKRQEEAPYQIGLSQVFPGVMINGIMGGLFFNSFLARLESTGIQSPLEIVPLIFAVYFGVQAVVTCGRMNK
mmetsp:Transcript_30193/g.72478  ORF Transcript_30193/g.72478 Transcript_30193/m.72478 type:complete len:250 (-) Transcript_30193:71-820(-)